MPLFTYECSGCGVRVDLLESLKTRDDFHSHCDVDPLCDGVLRRLRVQPITVGKASYQPGAVLADGSVVAGHFGKDARRKGGYYRP